jgi:NAD dependent epimerase/dehydratase family enzyme
MRRPAFVIVPSSALRLVLGEALTLAFDGQRVVPKWLLGAGYSFQYKTLQTLSLLYCDREDSTKSVQTD